MEMLLSVAGLVDPHEPTWGTPVEEVPKHEVGSELIDTCQLIRPAEEI
jgi:hypothetical protein